MKNFLTDAERIELETQHKKSRDVGSRDRLKAILSRNEGLGYNKIARVLRSDASTVRRHVEEYLDNKKTKSGGGGSQSKLNEKQTSDLIDHLKKNIYLSVKAICHYVEMVYRIKYSRQGMTDWLLRNNFIFKKPIGVPAKANAQAQEAFIQEYEQLKKEMPANEPILFGDSFHPTQTTRITKGWIHQDVCAVVPTTGNRTRVNITGAIHLNSMHLVTQESEIVNAESFIQFLKKIEKSYPDAPTIHLIVDRGPVHTSTDVKEYLLTSRIKLRLLPPYSPNLNPIERLWKLFHKHVSNNKHYSTGKDFKTAISHFFAEAYHRLKSIFSKTINDQFQRLPIATY